jgi:valyl-tRNA synthetase
LTLPLNALTIADKKPQQGDVDMTRYLITSALPYINGMKHLGNLIGSMLPADVYSRFLRLEGGVVLFICATDEHGTPASRGDGGRVGRPGPTATDAQKQADFTRSSASIRSLREELVKQNQSSR